MNARDGVVVIDCAEYDDIEIDASLWLTESHETRFNPEIDGRDVLRARFHKGVLRVQATSHVGVIPLNDRVVVRVRPRVPIANLTRMVVETGHSVLPLSAFRDYAGRGTAGDWAMDVYTDALLDLVDELLDAGRLREYRRHEGEGHLPHGSIDFTRTVQRFAARGISHKAAYTWFERTVDTPHNRCVKAAMLIVHDHLSKTRAKPRKGNRARLARLAGQLGAFDEVSEDIDYRFLDDPHVLGLLPLPDPRAYYRPVLDLAVVIVRAVGLRLELGGNDVRLTSLLIDTNRLLENFVRVSLAKHAAKHRWPVEVLDGNTDHGRVDLYDVPDPLPAPLGTPLPALASRDPGKAQPDVVLKTIDGAYPLIAEVKNTAHGVHAATDSLPERGEVEQAVTYALRYGLPFTLLIHPWVKGAKGLVYVGRVRSIDVYDYRLDLSSEQGVDRALADMAGAVAALAGLDGARVPAPG